MLRKLARFLIVGVGCAFLYFGLAFVLRAHGGLRPFMATIAAYVISFGIAYVLQRTWTFQATTRHAVTLPRYAAVQGTAALLTATLTEVIAHFQPTASALAIAAVSTVIAAGLSFVLSSTWVFNHVPGRSK